MKHADGRFEKVPYFCLPANDLKDVIAPSCYSCFDYVNGLADLVVGYMGVPMSVGVEMTAHPQYVTVRNARGKELFDSVREKCEVTPSVSSGNRTPFVVQTVVADDEATLGRGPTSGAPRFVGNALAYVLEKVGPKGKEFGMYSLDYHTVRNFLYVKRHFGSDARANQHVPGYARRIVDEYNENGAVDARLAITGTAPVGPPTPPAPAVRTDARAGRGRRTRRIAVRGNRPERHRRRVGVRSGLGNRLEGHGGRTRDGHVTAPRVPTVEYSFIFRHSRVATPRTTVKRARRFRPTSAF